MLALYHKLFMRMRGDWARDLQHRVDLFLLVPRYHVVVERYRRYLHALSADVSQVVAAAMNHAG